MLSDFRVHPSLATADTARARTWYAEKLGIEPAREWEGLLVYSMPPTMFTVFQAASAGTAQNTVAIWLVDDLRAEVARLRARGLVFEELDYGDDDRTIDGIMTSTDPKTGEPVFNAWFRDSDGNWISIVEQPEHPGEPHVEPGYGLMLAASDLARARAWYEDKLGLEALHVVDDEEVVFLTGMTRFSVYTTPAAGSAKNTVGVWRVDDLRSEMAALRARGVVFNDYDLGAIRTVDGILTDPDDGTLNAWFTDSEGNVLGIVEDHGEPLL